MKETAGYTLIEILVVMLIISIVTSVALLSIGRNSSRQLEAQAAELTQLISLAQEQAMLQPAVLGLSLSGHEYHFMSLQQAAAGKKHAWVPVTDEALRKHVLPGDISIELTVKGSLAEHEKSGVPQIIISPNGDITPFSIYLGRDGGSTRYVITGEANGNLANKKL